MFRNYFTVAMRSLRRHKFFSFINIFGLALSMSICLGIIMLVADQLTYDHYNTKRDRIYRLTIQNMNPDGSASGNVYATSPLPMAEALREDFTGIEKSVRIRRGFGNGWIKFDQDINIPLGGFFADPEALDLFEYELEYGDRRTALNEPYAVVLTKKAARKLFKQENPVGEIIKMGTIGDYKVTGIIKEKEQKSHIVFEALASYATVKSLEAADILRPVDSSWGNFTAGWVYLLVEKDRKPSEVLDYMAALAKDHKPDKYDANDNRAYRFELQKLTAITPGPFINNAIGPFMPQIFVYFFGGLALIVMLTSCFNYTNLSIARSLTRAREIGVRKVNGAHRFQIFSQFISEAVLISLLSLGLAVLMLMIVKPFLLNLQFAQILKWDLEGNVYVYAVFLLFSVAVGIMAGFFPSVVLSGFQPIKVLKNAGGMKLFSRMGLRKTLLVFQFSLSLIFILSVLLLYNQLKLFIRADLGFDMKNKINVVLNDTKPGPLQAELSKYANIESVAGASHIPAAGTVRGDGFKRQISDGETQTLPHFCVDAEYLHNMNLSLVAGRNFDPAAGESNKKFIIINEQAVKKFLFASPHEALGEIVYAAGDSAAFEIIGVVKDYNHEVLMMAIGPMALRYDPESFRILQVRYTGEREDAVKTIEEAWAKVNPSYKLDYKDFEEEIRLYYKTVFSDLVSLVGVISFMAIVISCLGLLGMATYATETRMKEISIRKVLGSTDRALVMLLSRGFLKLIFISILLAVPAAWFINNLWLEMIAYHTEFSVAVIATGVLMLLLLGVLTIGSQTLRAAFANPVDSLKNE